MNVFNISLRFHLNAIEDRNENEIVRKRELKEYADANLFYFRPYPTFTKILIYFIRRIDVHY